MSSINPAKLAQIETDEITSMLQAPNAVGTNKLLINVNGNNSKIKTNKNGIIKYTLETPVKLEIGDKVTLIDSFIEERGLSVDTMSFETDVEEEMRFLYYTQGDLRNNKNIEGNKPFSALGADQEFVNYPGFYPDCYTGQGQAANVNIAVMRNVNNSAMLDLGKNVAGSIGFFGNAQWKDPQPTPGTGIETVKGDGMPVRNEHCFPCWNNIDTPPGVGENGEAEPNFKGSGDAIERAFFNTGNNGQYYYMCEFFGASNAIMEAKDTFFRPMYGAAKIKIPAGNYSVTALANLVNGQLNGNLANASKPNVDVMEDRLYNKNRGNAVFSQTVPAFDGIISDSVLGPDQTIADFNPDSLIIGEDTHQAFQRRRGDVVTRMYFNSDLTANRINMFEMNYLNAAVISPNDPPPGLGTLKYANKKSLYEPGDQTSNGGYRTCTDIIKNKDAAYNASQPGRQTFHNTNFYLHLDGLTTLFESTDEGGQYFNQTVVSQDDINEKYGKSNMPTLADMFLGNIGPTGLYYFDQNPSKYNLGGYPEEEPKPILERQYYYKNDITHYRFMCLFPITGAGDGTPPGIEFMNDKGNPLQYTGTTALELKYDGGIEDRFSIENLHEPYKLPSAEPGSTSSTQMGGQQATCYNQPVIFQYEDYQNGTVTQPKLNSPIVTSCGVYPIDCVSGIAVNNFSFSTVKSTTVYKDLEANIKKYNTNNTSNQMYREKLIYDLFTKPYEQFFTSEREAQTAWDTTFWSRLGFGYNQFGDISKNLEDVHTFSNPKTGDSYVERAFDSIRSVKQKGIITHNQFNNTFIVSSGGLGIANPYRAQGGTANQNYTMRSYNVATNDVDGLGGGGYAQNYINLLCDSQPIVAESFPSLNGGRGYLVIKSDIVKQNAIDSNSTATTIVGVVSKQNASNDTLYNTINTTEFTITQPKLLATIEVQIANPDGTIASDNVIGKNNSFMFKIEKAIQPSKMTLESF